ncbi:MAG: hypothetical protein AABX51_08840, partial [Nanoarchaeota archaeon]
MALNEEENILLANLLNKANNTEIKGAVWHELVKKFMTVSVELFVLDDSNQIFLIRRPSCDPEFTGCPYQMPGTVVNDWENVNLAKERLIQTEIVPAGLEKITEPKI